jgi:hypothetical protein
MKVILLKDVENLGEEGEMKEDAGIDKFLRANDLALEPPKVFFTMMLDFMILQKRRKYMKESIFLLEPIGTYGSSKTSLE